MKSSFLLSIILILSSIGAHADQKRVVLQLDDAINQGLVYSPALKKAESQLRQSVANISQAKSMIFPTITATGSGEEDHNALNLVDGSVPTTNTANGENYQVSLNLNQPIYAGGALTGGLDAAKTAKDLAQQVYYSTKQTLLQQIIAAYLNLDSAQASLSAAQANRKITEDYEDVVRRYEKIGRNRKMDLLQAQANASLARADVESATASLKTANNDLAILIGAAPGTVFETRYKINIYKLEAFDTENAFQEAVRNNPDVRQTTFQTESVGYQRIVAFATDMPSLSLVASGGYTAGDRPDLFNSDSKFYKIGLNLTVPLFSGLSSIAKGHNYDELLIQAQKNEDVERNTIRQGIQDQLTALHSAENQLRFARDGVQQAKEALDLANQGYKLGTASNTDVIALQATRYSAEKLLLSSEYNYLQALLTLRQTMGIDLEKAYEKS